MTTRDIVVRVSSLFWMNNGNAQGERERIINEADKINEMIDEK